jgi:hypothetical protein
MPELYRLNHSGAVIRMFADDHAPPHFHVDGPDWACQIRLSDLNVMRGSAPPDVLNDVRAWAIANHVFLGAKWRELNERDG